MTFRTPSRFSNSLTVRIAVACGLAVTATAAAHAASSHQKHITVNGLSLGMTPAQVRAYVKAHPQKFPNPTIRKQQYRGPKGNVYTGFLKIYTRGAKGKPLHDTVRQNIFVQMTSPYDGNKSDAIYRRVTLPAGENMPKYLSRQPTVQILLKAVTKRFGFPQTIRNGKFFWLGANPHHLPKRTVFETKCLPSNVGQHTPAQRYQSGVKYCATAFGFAMNTDSQYPTHVAAYDEALLNRHMIYRDAKKQQKVQAPGQSQNGGFTTPSL